MLDTKGNLLLPSRAHLHAAGRAGHLRVSPRGGHARASEPPVGTSASERAARAPRRAPGRSSFWDAGTSTLKLGRRDRFAAGNHRARMTSPPPLATPTPWDRVADPRIRGAPCGSTLRARGAPSCRSACCRRSLAEHGLRARTLPALLTARVVQLDRDGRPARRLRSDSIQQVIARVGDGQALPLDTGLYSGAYVGSDVLCRPGQGIRRAPADSASRGTGCRLELTAHRPWLRCSAQ